jgi:hypothetical protein
MRQPAEESFREGTVDEASSRMLKIPSGEKGIGRPIPQIRQPSDNSGPSEPPTPLPPSPKIEEGSSSTTTSELVGIAFLLSASMLQGTKDMDAKKTD